MEFAEGAAQNEGDDGSLFGSAIWFHLILRWTRCDKFSLQCALTAAFTAILSVAVATRFLLRERWRRKASTENCLVVGYAFMGKKKSSAKFLTEAPTSQTRLRWMAIDLARLDRGEPLAAQGKFDVLIHKLTDDVHHAHMPTWTATSENLQTVARRRLAALCDYQTSMKVPLVDNPEMVANVVSRAVTCRLLKTLHDLPVGNLRLMAPRFFIHDPSTTHIPLAPRHDDAFAVRTNGEAASSSTWGSSSAHRNDDSPPCLGTPELTLKAKLAGAPFTYPLICKPVAASGGNFSKAAGIGPHCLTVVLKEEGLKQVPYQAPTIFQEYVNHDARLLKVYVVGREVRVFARQSLPNLPSDLALRTAAPDMVVFNSQKPYPTSRELLGEEEPVLGEEEPASISSRLAYRRGRIDDTVSRQGTPEKFASYASIPTEALKLTARQLQCVFGLDLFGFDAVLISKTNHLMVIDVNYFPSYKELQSELPCLLSEHFTQLCR